MNVKLELLRLRIADKLCGIEDVLPSSYRLTLVARNTEMSNADIIVSNDDEAKALEAAAKLLPPTSPPSAARQAGSRSRSRSPG